MSALPLWVQVLQALLVPSIAIAVGIVAFLQWRTAHQKVVLDLFDKRLKVYDEVNEAVIYFFNETGNLVAYNAMVRLHRVWTEAQFLFDKDVAEKIEEIRATISRLSTISRRLESTTIGAEQRAKLQDEVAELDEKLNGWKAPFTDLCKPYLAMDQKRVRTPVQWFHDRNAIRKSRG